MKVTYLILIPLGFGVLLQENFQIAGGVLLTHLATLVAVFDILDSK